MKQIELYVPSLDNDGIVIPERCWNWLHETLLWHFGGYTVYDAQGSWKSGTVLDDKNCIYRILIEEHPSMELRIKQIAEAVKHYWKQESVLYTISDIDAVFV